MNARLWSDGEPVTVTCDDYGRPQAFRWGSQCHEVERICNRWRVHEDWWKADDDGWREYIKLTTQNGILCLLARDLENDSWVLVRIYD